MIRRYSMYGRVAESSRRDLEQFREYCIRSEMENVFMNIIDSFMRVNNNNMPVGLGKLYDYLRSNNDKRARREYRRFRDRIDEVDRDRILDEVRDMVSDAMYNRDIA